LEVVVRIVVPVTTTWAYRRTLSDTGFDHGGFDPKLKSVPGVKVTPIVLPLPFAEENVVLLAANCVTSPNGEPVPIEFLAFILDSNVRLTAESEIVL
jgi:hypothetical protein